ncbi:MAG TPA: hypothetical protein VGM03_01220 [Phycisphaerae bacterium]|jgi:hypothetical protein
MLVETSGLPHLLQVWAAQVIAPPHLHLQAEVQSTWRPQPEHVAVSLATISLHFTALPQLGHFAWHLAAFTSVPHFVQRQERSLAVMTSLQPPHLKAVSDAFRVLPQEWHVSVARVSSW